MKNSRTFVSVLACASLVAAFSVVGAAPANAYSGPSACGSTKFGNIFGSGAIAWCNQGTGYVAAVAGCKWAGWWTAAAVGPYVNIAGGGDTTSRVTCPWPFSVQWTGYFLR